MSLKLKLKQFLFLKRCLEILHSVQLHQVDFESRSVLTLAIISTIYPSNKLLFISFPLTKAHYNLCLSQSPEGNSDTV